MQEIRHVKNPLTVIAIFAGLAEGVSAIVLPFLEPTVQSTFIWFVMIFPIFLVGLFFYTLHHNHKVLYAPSDYSNEENFLALIKATTEETNNKIENEVHEIINDTEEVKKVANDYKSNLKIAEKLSLQKLGKRLNLKILKGYKFNLYDNSTIIPDGLVIEDSKISIFEVKYTHRRTFKKNIEDLFKKFEKLQDVINDRKFEFHLVIVYQGDKFNIKSFEKKVQDILEEKAMQLSPIIHFFDFKVLENE